MEETITINIDEYETLLAESLKLVYLQGVGVENWEGYDEAREQWNANGMDYKYGSFYSI